MLLAKSFATIVLHVVSNAISRYKAVNKQIGENRMQKLYVRRQSVLGMFFIVSAVVLAAGHRVSPLTEEQAAEYQLDTAFYKKCTMVLD